MSKCHTYCGAGFADVADFVAENATVGATKVTCRKSNYLV